MVSEESPSGGKREQSQPEKRDWQEKAPSSQPKEKEREAREKDREKEKDRERVKEKTAQNEVEVDFERTPSGRVRRRSAQVAVFHLQEIAEDELAKDWGTKRRIKDDLVPDSKRVRRESGSIIPRDPHVDIGGRHKCMCMYDVYSSHTQVQTFSSIAYYTKIEESTHIQKHTQDYILTHIKANLSMKSLSWKIIHH